MIKCAAKTIWTTSLVFVLFIFGQSANALTVGPLKTDLTINPGETKVINILVVNETDKISYIEARVSPFVPQDDQGSIALAGDALVTSWVTITADSFALAPGEVREVPVVVSIPASATPGGYYGVALFKSGAGPRQAGNKVGVSGQIGSLLLIKVEGELNHQLTITDFKVLNGDWWWRDNPLKLSIAIANQGNVHELPDGMVVISDVFGRAVASTPINPNASYVLPGGERQFGFDWQIAKGQDNLIFGTEWSPWLVGPYTIEIKGYYGDDRQVLTADSQTIWIVPIRTLVILFAIIIVVVVGKLFIKRRTQA